MKKRNNDDLFKELADKYVEQYGDNLKKENEFIHISRQNFATPHLDQRVRREIKKTNKKTYRYFIPAMVACLILIVTIPAVNFIVSQVSKNYIMHEVGQIPFSNPMPDRFEIEDVEQDEGKTIYYLKEKHQNDIILEMERTEINTISDDFKEIRINGKPAYLLEETDYSVLIFEKYGIAYKMTCRYESSTLVEFAEKII